MEFVVAIIVIVLVIYIYRKHKSGDNVKNYKDEYNYEKTSTNSNRSTISAKIKGKTGEIGVANILGWSISGKKYVFNNYKFRDGVKTIQIDHILINQNGVFVIETKSYEGYIVGAENSLNWKQYLAGGKVVNEFYNPVKQNKTHVYYIRNMLPKSINVYSVIVFTKADVTSLNISNVILSGQLKRYINTNRGNVIDTHLITDAYDILKRCEDKSISNKEHIKNVKKTIENINENVCPRCKGKLVKRNGKYGEFYGCENYPRCTFIKRQ